MEQVAQQEKTSLPPLPKRFSYHILFSYSSADDVFVQAVHDALPKEVKVFNYKRADSRMVGRKLDKELEHRYRNEAPFCAIFLSKSYLASPYTKQELRIVSRVAKWKPGYMLPVRIDDSPVPEIEGIVWLDTTLTAAGVAERLLEAIKAPPPKPWWFFVSLEVKIAAAAALFALIFFAGDIANYFRPSNTSLRSATASAQGITAHLVNSGPKSATLVRQQLLFGELPIEDKELRLAKASSATILPGEHDVQLLALELVTECNADGIRPDKYQVEALLGPQPVTLVIDVRESDDAPGRPTRRSVTFPAATLKPLVRKVVAGDASDC